MHRIPRVFRHSSNRSRTGADSGAASTSTSSSSSPAAKPRPRLDRRNAKNNINYEYSPSASSSSSHFSNDESLRTRSLDLYDGKTSFRVEGVDGEIEIICENLGLSIDDLAINREEYEAMKVRSNSAPVVFTQSIEPLVDRKMKAIPIISRNCEVNSNDNVSVVSSNGLVRVNGIKGARPPLMTLPKIEKQCSAWDMSRVFTPDSGAQISRLEQGICSDEDDESLKRRNGMASDENCVQISRSEQGLCSDEDDESLKRRSGMARDENCVLSASCSFTASSNDDDSSSTTTEPMMSTSPNGRFKRIISEWQKGELLGRGSFGSVYEGIADCGFFFAVKEVSLLDQDDEGKQRILQLEQEIALLSQFEHANIVQYYGTKKDESKLYIFLELVTKGSLLSLYQKYTLRDSQVWSYTRQILHGLKYLHDRNVVHRDIKCANILVDTNGSVKLADFGLAKATKLNDVKSCKGTPFWMAPEVVRSLGYGLPADIWSLGCTVLEMLTGRFPYSNLECQMAALFRIGRGERPAIPESVSNDARDFILKCLQVEPSLRPTAAELLDHPFVVPPLPLPSTSSGFASPHFSNRHHRM